MSILIKGMEMPKDCPMCHFAHWDFTGEFRGCNAVNGKKYAMETEPGYPETNFRPSWCPLIPVHEHGRLIDADALPTYDKPIGKMMMFGGEYVYTQTAIDNASTIIPADKEGEG